MLHSKSKNLPVAIPGKQGVKGSKFNAGDSLWEGLAENLPETNAGYLETLKDWGSPRKRSGALDCPAARSEAPPPL